MSNFTLLGSLELVKKFVWWWWWVCKAILVFYFGPDQALGLGLRLGPSRTISNLHITVFLSMDPHQLWPEKFRLLLLRPCVHFAWTKVFQLLLREKYCDCISLPAHSTRPSLRPINMFFSFIFVCSLFSIITQGVTNVFPI